MEGFRPAFYAEDPKLTSIELLAWAAAQPCFTAGDLQAAFAKELSTYKDAVHEVSERLRKLANSGMIVAIDQTRLESVAPTASLDGPRKAGIELRAQRLAEESKGKRGRPARIYIITNAGSKQVARRAEELTELGKKRQEEAGQAP